MQPVQAVGDRPTGAGIECRDVVLVQTGECVGAVLGWSSITYFISVLVADGEGRVPQCDEIALSFTRCVRCGSVGVVMPGPVTAVRALPTWGSQRNDRWPTGAHPDRDTPNAQWRHGTRA
jgi:hypothetical protein